MGGPDGGKLDRMIHEPARLRILTALYVLESADFLFLLNQTGLTRGNLSAHMSKLEAAGYLEIQKEFRDRKPHTMMKLTAEGRQALAAYRRRMTQLLEDLPG